MRPAGGGDGAADRPQYGALAGEARDGAPPPPQPDEVDVVPARAEALFESCESGLVLRCVHNSSSKRFDATSPC
jgi:hypothetical protein